MGEVIAVDMNGTAEVMAEGPPRMGWSIDWLPDGRLITTGPSVTRREPDGTRVTHCEQGLLCNEFEGVDQLTAVQGRRTARILVTEAPVPRAS